MKTTPAVLRMKRMTFRLRFCRKRFRMAWILMRVKSSSFRLSATTSWSKGSWRRNRLGLFTQVNLSLILKNSSSKYSSSHWSSNCPSTCTRSATCWSLSSTIYTGRQSLRILSFISSTSSSDKNWKGNNIIWIRRWSLMAIPIPMSKGSAKLTPTESRPLGCLARRAFRKRLSGVITSKDLWVRRRWRASRVAPRCSNRWNRRAIT